MISIPDKQQKGCELPPGSMPSEGRTTGASSAMEANGGSASQLVPSEFTGWKSDFAVGSRYWRIR
jgi:hypothetical protein